MPDSASLEEIRDLVKSQGEVLARLDERTLQHEKRMDRAEARAARQGGIWGSVGGFFGAFAAALVYLFTGQWKG